MLAPVLAIDAHAHVFRRGLPLAPGRRYAPDYDAPVDLYLRKLDENGLTHGLLVQPSFLGTDNTYLLQSLKRSPDRLRGVAVVDALVGPEELARMNAAGIVGIRLNLLGQPLPDLRAGGWPDLFGELARMNWHVEVQRGAADLPTIVETLLETGLHVVIDHFGLPDSTLGANDPAWLAILPHARSGRLWMKLSAPYRTRLAGVLIDQGVYLRLRDEFGLARLMWGSDWPHTQFESTQTYERSRAALTDLIGTEEEVAATLMSPASLLRLSI